MNPVLLYRSTDLGESWVSITPKQDDTLKENTFTVDMPPYFVVGKDGKTMLQVNTTSRLTASGEKVIAMTNKGDYYSSDAGESWTRLDNADNAADASNAAWLNANLTIGDCKDTGLQASNAAWLNANTFYRGGTQGIQRSTDGGKSWHQFNTGLVNVNVKHLSATNDILYANTESELARSNDGGETWVRVPIDTGYHTRIVKSDGKLYARDNNNGIHQFFRVSSEDNSFTSIPGMPSFKNVTKESLKNVTKESLIIEIDYSGILRQPLPEEFAVTATSYYMKYKNRLFRWRIGTLNWYDTGITNMDKMARKESNPDVLNSKDFRFAVSGDTVYVGRGDGHLMLSFDEGDRWTDVTANLPFSVERFNAITFVGQSVYVATDKGVARSDNGTDWHILTDVEGTPLVIGRFAEDGTTVYGTAKRKVYQLKEGADTWLQVTSEIPYPVTSFDVDGNTLYVGTRGRGVLRFTLDE